MLNEQDKNELDLIEIGSSFKWLNQPDGAI